MHATLAQHSKAKPASIAASNAFPSFPQRIGRPPFSPQQYTRTTSQNRLEDTAPHLGISENPTRRV